MIGMSRDTGGRDVATVPIVGPAERTGQRRAYTEMIMGLPFSIHLRGEFEDVTEATAVQRVWDDLRRYDRIFSTYRSDSDICRINRDEITVADADPAVAKVLALAERARAATGGAFDVYYAGSLDPSGIVKGWAASRAAAHLEPLGSDYYLNAGGDVLLRSAATGAPWRVGIEHPADTSGLLAVLQATDLAVATSGSIHRGRHISDPATGSAASGVLQATVCGPDLVWADILATALVAAGPPAPGTWQWPDDYQFLLITDDGQVRWTSGIAALLA